MIHRFLEGFRALEAYSYKEKFKGWDPYDGLNSTLFQALPYFRGSDIARLVWIQLFKRNPINIRGLAKIQHDYNPKGIALFLSGYCNIFRYNLDHDEKILGDRNLLNTIIELADLLVSLKTPGYSGACWGYNFDWQARRLFLFPKGTPTVVVTSFCASALFDAYEITGDEKYLYLALSSAEFVLNDLHRTDKKNGFLFSYSPLPGNDTVYNASLLGSKLLSHCYKYNKDQRFSEAAYGSVLACTDAQNPDGSWYYGELQVQKWIDSFHTGYNLEALLTYQNNTGDTSFKKILDKGFKYYLHNFFLHDCTPKYYHNKTYPVDIHSPAQFIIFMSNSGKLKQYLLLTEKVIEWTMRNMQDKTGYFYYQKSRFITNRIPYMRWSNAFMFYALSCYFRSSADINE
jgi:rhamnogalacturonyl hydrolase YesR